MLQCSTALTPIQFSTLYTLPISFSSSSYFSVFLKHRTKQLTKMVDAGPKTAIALWCASLTVHFAHLLGLVNMTFMTVWSWSSILDKSYKLVSKAFEADFHAWLDQVWRSLFCRSGAANTETELPVFVRNRTRAGSVDIEAQLPMSDRDRNRTMV